MEKNMTFDPLAWIKKETENEQPAKQTAPVNNTTNAGFPFEGELAKAKAVTDELLRQGANIAESYDDYLQLGFALANGLGAEGGELFHQMCSQSTKYRQGECEKKWQECLKKNDGRTTIATFYKMAQDAGVDLSAISRQFPSNPSNPQFSTNKSGVPDRDAEEVSYFIDNKNINGNSQAIETASATDSFSREGMREMRETNVEPNLTILGTKKQFSETFSDKIDTEQLPTLLRMPVMMRDEDEDRDKMFLSCLLLYSGVMPNVFGIYHEKRVMPPFYLIMSAPSGARKGMIDDTRALVNPIESSLHRQYYHEKDEYQEQLAQYNALDRKQRASQREPEPPKYRSLFVAANSSSTAWQQSLADNEERGIMFETEADTLTQALKQEYGNYSDGLRKAFHHEQINYSRRTENEHVTVEHPQLAALLTCTPSQIPLLLSSSEVENGLASRFLFYNLKGGHDWKDPFASVEEPLAQRIEEVGKLYQELYTELMKRSDKPLQIVLSKQQQQLFNDYFKALLPEQLGLYGESFDAFVYRLGLVTFRMAMVFTILRCYEHQPYFESESQALVCDDADLQTVLTIVNSLVNHTAHVYNNFLVHDKPISPAIAAMSAQEKTFYAALSDEFTTAQCREITENIGIPWKTAERYLGSFVSKHHVAIRIRNGVYRKSDLG